MKLNTAITFISRINEYKSHIEFTQSFVYKYLTHIEIFHGYFTLHRTTNAYTP